MEQRILHQNQTKLPNSARRLEVLRQCIGSIFENRLADAKKTFPGNIFYEYFQKKLIKSYFCLFGQLF